MGHSSAYSLGPAVVYDDWGLTSDPTAISIADWLNIADNPSIWGGAPPATVVDSTPALVGLGASRTRAIRIPGASDAGGIRLVGLGQAQAAGAFVASVELSVVKNGTYNAVQTAGCSAGLLWVDASGQNMVGTGFDIGGNRGIAASDTNAFSRLSVWNASGDANNDPTGLWTVGGGTNLGYGNFRARFTLARDGADAIECYSAPSSVGAVSNMTGSAIATAGGAGFLVCCIYHPAAASIDYDLIIHSQLLTGTVLPWLVTP